MDLSTMLLHGGNSRTGNTNAQIAIRDTRPRGEKKKLQKRKGGLVSGKSKSPSVAQGGC